MTCPPVVGAIIKENIQCHTTSTLYIAYSKLGLLQKNLNFTFNTFKNSLKITCKSYRAEISSACSLHCDKNCFTALYGQLRSLLLYIFVKICKIDECLKLQKSPLKNYQSRQRCSEKPANQVF